MKVTLLRLAIIATILFLLISNVQNFLQAITKASTSEMSLFYVLMEMISTLILALPLILVLLWVLYNLRPVKWLSPETFSQIIKYVWIVSAVALVASTAQYFKQSAPYLPNFTSENLSKFIQLMNWFPYSVADLSLLGFAYLQLKAKAKNQPMAELSS